jgi:hypothetical protein
LTDGDLDAVNRAAPEYLAKDAMAGMFAFWHVKRTDDWKRPRNPQNANWSSKVDWDVYERVNPRASPDELRKFRALNAEVQRSRSHDISVQGIADRLKSLAVDRANN